MDKRTFTPRFIFVFSIVIIAAVLRLIPHWPNFTPIAAIALFGGASLNKKWLAFVIPVTAMLLSDLIIGFHTFMIPVYVSFIITVFMGMNLLKNRKAHRIAFTAIASSVIFFIFTNFAVWMGSPFYSQDFTGLFSCFTLALPFFGVSLLGDLFYSTLFFGVFYLSSIKFPVLARI